MIDAVPELLAAVGPRIRTSPYFDATVRAGLVSVSCYNHMWLPMSYGDPAAEYRRLVEAVSMWDVAAQRHVAVTGPDADRVVQYVTAVDLGGLGRGRATYAPVVDHDGTLINDPIVLHMPDGSWRFSIADSDLRLWIDAVARTVGYDCGTEELETATLAIQGPRTDEVLTELGLSKATSLEDFEVAPARIADAPDEIDVVVSRTGWSNQGGVELFLDDPTKARRLWDVVAEAGTVAGIGPGAPNPAERLENVLLSYGTDTGYDADPLELGLGDHLDIDGPEFVGRAALRTIRASGPARRLSGVTIPDSDLDVLARPAPLTIEGCVVGQLRAAARSPRYDTVIGLALVDSDTAPGAVACGPGGTTAVELVELPFERSLGAIDRAAT